MESVTVPSTVTSIGNNAFYLSCKNAINLSAVSETASIVGCTQNVTRGCMIYLPSETVKNNLSYSGTYEPIYLITMVVSYLILNLKKRHLLIRLDKDLPSTAGMNLLLLLAVPLVLWKSVKPIMQNGTTASLLMLMAVPAP